VLEPTDWPAGLAPRFMHFRAQSSTRLLLDDASIDFDEVVQYRNSTRLELADRVLPDLLVLLGNSAEPLLQEAGRVLGQWDRRTAPESSGAVLFQAWFTELQASGSFGHRLFREPWDPARPFETPIGLADSDAALAALRRACEATRENFGRLDVAWGDAVRIRYAGRDLPSNLGPGSLGAFSVAFLESAPAGRLEVIGGNSYTAVIEFGERVKAQGILAYGNATSPSSPHHGDQLDLLSSGQLRDIHFYPDEISRHVKRRETLVYREPDSGE
jgi:acyl-homoserine-lactone acylase